uniref:CAP domain-containing protein (inferred by orthology to a zebrafish protein) n=1 Tax=Strongyloides venezuelensis TaxID=75913 RepID=A0A0K0G0I8_STRVS
MQITYQGILYGACPLRQNTKLDKSAQVYANMFSRNYITRIHYEEYGVYNDAVRYIHLTKIISCLYSKRIFYNYRHKAGKKLEKKFTQLIWKDTTQIGNGIAKFRKYFYIVLLFYTKGNIEGHYEKNVSEEKISWKKIAKIK